MIAASNHQPKTISYSLLFPLIVLTLLLFGVVTYPYLSSWANVISGAESGTVTINITGKIGGEGGGERQLKVREGGKLISLELEVIPEEIVEELEEHQGKLIQLRLRNRGTKVFRLTLFTDVKILKIPQPEIVLPPGEQQTVTVIIDTSQRGIYVGTLTIEGLFAFKQLPVQIRIDAPTSYSVDVTIPEPQQRILSGQDIFAAIVIEPLQGGMIAITYVIKDNTDTIILREQEQTSAPSPRLSFQKTFALPDTLPLGRYYLIVETDYKGKVAHDVTHFTIVDRLVPQEEYPRRLYSESPLVFFLIIFAILILHIIMTRSRKH